MNHCWLYTFLFMLDYVGIVLAGVAVFLCIVYGTICAVEWLTPNKLSVIAHHMRYPGYVLASILMIAFLVSITSRVHSNICAKGFATFWHEVWK